MTQQKSEVRFSRLKEYHEYKMRKSKQPSTPPYNNETKQV